MRGQSHVLSYPRPAPLPAALPAGCSPELSLPLKGGGFQRSGRARGDGQLHGIVPLVSRHRALAPYLHPSRCTCAALQTPARFGAESRNGAYSLKVLDAKSFFFLEEAVLMRNSSWQFFIKIHCFCVTGDCPGYVLTWPGTALAGAEGAGDPQGLAQLPPSRGAGCRAWLLRQAPAISAVQRRHVKTGCAPFLALGQDLAPDQAVLVASAFFLRYFQVLIASCQEAFVLFLFTESSKQPKLSKGGWSFLLDQPLSHWAYGSGRSAGVLDRAVQTSSHVMARFLCLRQHCWCLSSCRAAAVP